MGQWLIIIILLLFIILTILFFLYNPYPIIENIGLSIIATMMILDFIKRIKREVKEK